MVGALGTSTRSCNRKICERSPYASYKFPASENRLRRSEHLQTD